MNTTSAKQQSAMDAYRAASNHALEQSFSRPALPAVPSKLACPETHPHDHGGHRATVTRSALAEQPFAQRTR
jgi:hypothetical protein